MREREKNIEMWWIKKRVLIVLIINGVEFVSPLDRNQFNV